MDIFINIIISASVSSGIAFIFKSYLTTKIKEKIKFEYAKIFEDYKIQLQSTFEKEIAFHQKVLDENERINTEKWILKREACLKALEIADAILSNMDWDIDSEKIVKQPVSTIEYRKCYNQLACSCDNNNVISLFKKFADPREVILGDIMTDFRNEVRKELNFGDNSIDLDRSASFFARIHGDAYGLNCP